MRTVLLAVLVALNLANSAAAELYQQVRVIFGGPVGQARLLRTGISLDEGVTWQRDAVEVILSEPEKRKLEAAGFRITVLNPDMESYYRARLEARPRAPNAPGKMGGFYTYSETLRKLQSFRQKYKSLISAPLEIGRSLEGRPIFAVRISDNASTNEDEPETLYTALTHAREPQSLMCLLYFMEKVLQGYGKDPQITYILNNRQLWFVPVVNPDGYVYNEQTNPSGGGMWRKNRRLNSDGTSGVDLNRNFGYFWGYDDLGSSPNGRDEVYRGTGPFSEPETAAVRTFVKSRKFITAFQCHSFWNALIYPWNYIDGTTPHHWVYWSMARLLTAFNEYDSGNSSRIVRYTVNGDATDWFYGEVNEKPRVFSFTPEIGNHDDQFWPAGERIQELSAENFEANLTLAGLAGEYPVVWGYQFATYPGGGRALFKPGGHYQIKVTIRNIGLGRPTGNFTVRLSSPTTRAIVEAGSVNFTSINPLRNKTRAGLRFQVSTMTKPNQQTPLEFLIYIGDLLLRKETVSIRTESR